MGWRMTGSAQLAGRFIYIFSKGGVRGGIHSRIPLWNQAGGFIVADVGKDRFEFLSLLFLFILCRFVYGFWRSNWSQNGAQIIENP